jgi:hypothetical protein
MGLGFYHGTTLGSPNSSKMVIIKLMIAQTQCSQGYQKLVEKF